MKKQPRIYKDLYIDQYGSIYYARSIKDLRSKIGNGGSKVSKMYEDFGGIAYHIGYVIGGHWLTKYQACIKKE